MLQNIRDNAHGWWTWVLVPILIVLFAFWGIGNYLGGSFSQNSVATVNGEDIPLSQFLLVNHQAVDQKTIMQSLQTLINQALLMDGLENLGFSISNETVDQLIYQAPAFQVNGAFSTASYQAALRSLGETTAELRSSLKQTGMINQFQNALISSQVVLPSEAMTESAYANLNRTIDYVVLNVNQFMPKVQPADSAVSAYYLSHQSAYMTPYKVQLQYLTLSLSLFGKGPNAQASYQAALNQLANVTFQNAHSLSNAANTFHLNLQTTAWLNTDLSNGILATAIVLRVTDSQAPTVLPLSTVKKQIVETLMIEQATQNMTQTIDAMRSAADQGQSLSQLAKLNGLSLQTQSQNLPPYVLSTMNSMAVGQIQAIPGSDNVILLQVLSVTPNPQGKNQVSAEQIRGLWTEAEMGQFLFALQAKGSIKINPAILKH
ncbi:MAG: SurA N-terminal domain-containing protein [Gammaproteobacteria bacterium]|nr:SurA N-terminal domain-containing protein [Gammaproteobacteria bacterium]